MRESDLPITRWCLLVDVMHLLSPPAWKIVSLIARDDLKRQADEVSPIAKLDGDLGEVVGFDMRKLTGPSKRAGLALADDPNFKWTRLSLAQICGGVVDRPKRKVENRGTGLAKSTVAMAIKEAVQLKILQKRPNKSSERGDLPTSYSIDWKRVTELVEESKRWSNVKSWRRSRAR